MKKGISAKKLKLFNKGLFDKGHREGITKKKNYERNIKMRKRDK